MRIGTPVQGLRGTVLFLMLAATLSCGGSTTTPAPIVSPVAPAAFVEPGDDDWALLGSQLAALAMDALQTALADGNTSASFSPFHTFGLQRPSVLSDFNASYYCCGSQLLTSSTLSTLTIATISASRSVLTYGSTFATNATTTWTRPAAPTLGLIIPTDAPLRMSATLPMTAGAINAFQQFDVLGSLIYTADPCALTLLPSCAVRKTAPIALALSYADVRKKDPPVATGQIGTYHPAGKPLPLATPAPVAPPTPAPTPSPTPTPTPTPAPTPSPTPGGGTIYSGGYSGTMVETTVSTSLTGGGTFACANSYIVSGTLSMQLQVSGSLVTGTATITGTERETGVSGDSSCRRKDDLTVGWSRPVSSPPSALAFSDQRTSANGAYSVTNRMSFSGALSNGVITGTLSFSVSGAGTIGGATSVSQNGSSAMSVTLR